MAQRSIKRYCALCHGADAQGYAADNAPSLTTVSFFESATDEYIANALSELAGRALRWPVTSNGEAVR